MITPSATNPKITERGMWNVFRTCGRDDQQGEVAGKYIADKFKGKKVAIVHDKTTYGQGLADETKKAMNQGRHEGSALRGHQHRREGLSRPSSPRSSRPAPTSSTGAACTPKAA